MVGSQHGFSRAIKMFPRSILYTLPSLELIYVLFQEVLGVRGLGEPQEMNCLLMGAVVTKVIPTMTLIHRYLHAVFIWI